MALVKGVVCGLGARWQRVMRFTNRGDFAINVFSELIQHTSKTQPDIIPWCGIRWRMRRQQLTYIAQGANFVRAQLCQVARLLQSAQDCLVVAASVRFQMRKNSVPEIVKLFPADALGGPDFGRRH